MSFVHLTQKEVDGAIEQMLDTPRKMLDYDTPREAFLSATGIHVKNNPETTESCV
jgi:IS30 family transposase